MGKPMHGDFNLVDGGGTEAAILRGHHHPLKLATLANDVGKGGFGDAAKVVVLSSSKG